MIVLNVGERNRHVGITINNNNNNSNIIINDTNSIVDQDKEHNLLCRNCYERNENPPVTFMLFKRKAYLGWLITHLLTAFRLQTVTAGNVSSRSFMMLMDVVVSKAR